MKKLITGLLSMIALGASVGCGSGASQEVANVIPNSGTLALDLTPSDSSATPVATDSSSQVAQGLTAPDCHPHLFQRTHEVVKRLNRHIFKIMARADAAIDHHPKAQIGNVYVWEKVIAGISVKHTLTKVSDTQFSFETDVKLEAAPDAAYVKVASGTVTTTDGQPHTGSGTISFDLTALASVVSTEQARGQITVAYSVSGPTKTLQIHVANFTFDDDGARPPRNANYVYQRTLGVGGSLKFQEDVVLFCPQNPNLSSASVETVSRWAKINGSIVGRSDSRGTGGQIPSGDAWLGLTCFDISQPVAADPDAERYWQMKLENGNGQVLTGDATYNASDASHPTSSCNPSVFGPVPDLGSNLNDFNFSAINFGDGSVVPYPGQPVGQ